MKNLMFNFKFNYCKNSIRKSFNTTLDNDLINTLKYIKKNTGIPVSEMIEVALQEHLQTQDSFDAFMDMCKKYNGF